MFETSPNWRMACSVAVSDGSRSDTNAREASVAFLLRAASSRLNASASRVCCAVTEATPKPRSARSFSSGATSRTDRPKRSCTTRALLASSSYCDSARATAAKASEGSWLFRPSTLRPIDVIIRAISESGFAAFNAWLNFTRAPPAVSRLVPVLSAVSSSADRLRMDEPVASARSFSASMPLMVF